MRGWGWSLCLLALVAAGPAGAGEFDITRGLATDTTAVGMADSSGVIRLNGLIPRFLRMKSFATGTSAQTTSSFAISLRHHKGGASDSNSITPMPLLQRSSVGASATVDSLVRTGDLLIGNPAAGSSFEVIVQFDRNRAQWHPRFGYLINLEEYFGPLTGLEFVSVKWRHLHGPGVATTWLSLVTAR